MAVPKSGPIPTTPSRTSIRLAKTLLIVALVFGGLGVVVIGTGALEHSLNGPPFQMVVEPVDGHATVQFLQAGTGRISKPFRIDRRIEKRQSVVLDSPTVAIPDGRIEFADTTILPGRFTIRLGETAFDVMDRGIDVDGQQFEWLNEIPSR